MSAPDTTDAVIQRLRDSGISFTGKTLTPIADVAIMAIAADRNALAEQGYEIVKVGSLPSWMEHIHRGSDGSYSHPAHCAKCNGFDYERVPGYTWRDDPEEDNEHANVIDNHCELCGEFESECICSEQGTS